MVTIGITGPNGRLGSELVANWGGERIDKDLNLLTPEDVNKFDVIINCAGFTHVDQCETPEGLKNALRSNMWGVDNLRHRFQGKLIHISTDYIFSGNKGPYIERNTKFNPVNAYGWSKWSGEVVLLTPRYESLNKNTVIVRTTGLYGGVGGRPDFVRDIRTTLEKLDGHLLVTNELHGNQTYIPHLAEALIKLAEMNVDSRIIHIGSAEVISRYDFALMVANIFGLDTELITPCGNKDVPGWVAARPTMAGLKIALAKRLRIPIYTILDGLKAWKEQYHD